MLTTAYYFLQVILCSALLMGYYWLVLRNKRFHQYNRFYLLAIALLSWIVPLIKIKWGHAVVSSEPQVFQFLNVVAYNNSQIEEKIIRKNFQWDWNVFSSSVYLLVSGILLISMIYALFRIYRLLKTHDCKSVGDVYLILTKAKGTPFSFFRYIFWNEEIDISSEAGKQILQHELTHVQQIHSFDKLLMQLVLIAGWFNPFFWLMKRELNLIHEFIADKKAVSNGDVATLAQMLLTAAYPRQQYMLTSPFFSPIKRRLQMLANHKDPRFSYVRRLVVLPLLAMVVVLFAFRNKEQGTHTLSVATVMEKVVEKGRELLLVEDFPMAQENGNPFHIIDPIAFQRRSGSYLNTDHVIDLANSTTYQSLVSEQVFTAKGIYKTDTIQPPRPGIVFQAIAKDAFNNPAKNRTVFVKIALLQGSISGQKVWEETHETKTDDQGAYSILIGQGEIMPGITKANIGEIDWGNGPFFMNTKIAIPPSIPSINWRSTDNYRDQSTVQMQTIPYEVFGYQRDVLRSGNNANQNATGYKGAEETQLGLHYQAKARDPLNNLAKNRTVFVKIRILHDSKNGDKVWEETHEAKTNDEGVYNITIGQGKRISGIVKSDLSQIDWNDGDYFMNTQVAVVPSIPAVWWVASDNYQDAGTVKMGGMPYQLYKGSDTKTVTPAITSFNLNMLVNGGVDITVPSNTTAIASIQFPGVKKGDPIIVTPQEDNQKWSIYSAWVADNDQIKVRFANFTDKEIKILGNQYKVVALKDDGNLNNKTQEPVQQTASSVKENIAANAQPGAIGPHDWYKFSFNSDFSKVTVYFKDNTTETYDGTSNDGKKKLDQVIFGKK